MPTLPASMTLTETERSELERHIAELGAVCEQMPEKDANAEQETLRAVTALMVVLPSMTMNELSAEARGEAYMDALDDVTSWAVKSAIRRWHRGDCGLNDQKKPYDYHWCPAPAELRRIAWFELNRILGRIKSLELLLRAEVRIEFSEVHRAEMVRRVAQLFHPSETSPVGNNGSGGAASAS
jgi:hypothetical protein